MRVDSRQQQIIKQLAAELAGKDAKVFVFGSRLDDAQRGGDLDLLVEVPDKVDNPAWLIALLSAKLSRVLGGRRVDVILSAPNLKTLPIHKLAKTNGIQL